MNTPEPVSKASFVSLVVTSLVAAIVAWLARNGLEVSGEWQLYLTVGATVVIQFLLGLLLWGWGKLSEKIPWNTVRDQVTPIGPPPEG